MVIESCHFTSKSASSIYAYNYDFSNIIKISEKENKLATVAELQSSSDAQSKKLQESVK